MRKLITSILLCATLVCQAADKVWCMVTDGGEKIAMSSIRFLLATDASETFSIVCGNGTVFYQVAKATFEQAEPSGISAIAADDQSGLRLQQADATLQVMGCPDGTQASVYDVAGRLVRQAVITASDRTVSVAGLPTGIYVLKAGKASVKFIKK